MPPFSPDDWWMSFAALLMLNGGQCSLLDLPRLSAQLSGPERRTARGRRDSIDHAPAAHDDCANAAAGALLLAKAQQAMVISREGFDRI
jgi:hypothetical protein